MAGPSRFFRHPLIIGLCQIATALIFMAAALPKIGDPATFASQIHNFRLVPFGLENLMAVTLPWIELLLGLAILLRVSPRAGAVTAAGLMVVFTAAVAQATARRLDIECGCFGTLDATKVGAAKLIENFGFMALAFVASLRSR